MQETPLYCSTFLELPGVVGSGGEIQRTVDRFAQLRKLPLGDVAVAESADDRAVRIVDRPRGRGEVCLDGPNLEWLRPLPRHLVVNEERELRRGGFQFGERSLRLLLLSP